MPLELRPAEVREERQRGEQVCCIIDHEVPS